MSREPMDGVVWNTARQQWWVRIRYNGKCHHLGYYDELRDAETARRCVEKMIRPPRRNYDGEEPQEWRPVVGYETRLEVSNLGNVRSTVAKGRLGSILTPQTDAGGYQRFATTLAPGFRKTLYIHRLVAQAFIPNPDGLPIVNHLDSNPSNNRVENLEWTTQTGNMRHASRAGRLNVPHPNAVRQKSPLAA